MLPIWCWTRTRTPPKIFINTGSPTPGFCLGPAMPCCDASSSPGGSGSGKSLPIGRKVLVTVGGTDPDNVTVRVIARAASAGERQSGSYDRGGREQSAWRSSGTGGPSVRAVSIRLLRNTFDMPKLMADADVAISAAGTTCWEMCFLGSAAVLIDVAENQTSGGAGVGSSRHRDSCGQQSRMSRRRTLQPN